MENMENTIKMLGSEVAKLQIENRKLMEEINRLKNELSCNIWFNAWKDKIKYRLQEVYERDDISDELIDQIAETLTYSDNVTEDMNEWIDIILHENGIDFFEMED